MLDLKMSKTGSVFAFAKSASLWVCTDSIKLTQVFSNLVHFLASATHSGS